MTQTRQMHCGNWALTPHPRQWIIPAADSDGAIHSVSEMHDTALARVDDARPEPPAEASEHRLGRVEIAVIRAIESAGGPIRREEALVAAYPGRTNPRQRALAHAGLSRALLTLERKGLIVRERDPGNTTTLVRAAGLTTLPDWEQLARAEEDLATHCGKTADTWDRLARRARQRARSIRSDRSVSSCDGERQADLAELNRLTGH